MNNMNNVVTTPATTFALGKRRKRNIDLANEDDDIGVNNLFAQYDIRNNYFAEDENNDYDYDYEENTNKDSGDEDEDDSVKYDHHWHYSNYKNNSDIYKLIDSIEIDNHLAKGKTIADLDNIKNVNDKKVIKIFNELNNENEDERRHRRH